MTKYHKPGGFTEIYCLTAPEARRPESKMSALSEGTKGRSLPGLFLSFGSALTCGSAARTVEAMAFSPCVCLHPDFPSKDTAHWIRGPPSSSKTLP